MEMERFNGKAKAEDQGVAALVLDLAKAFERVSFLVDLGFGDEFQLLKENIASVVRVCRAPEACAIRRMSGRAAQDHHGYLVKAEVELLALRIVLQDASNEVTKFTF